MNRIDFKALEQLPSLAMLPSAPASAANLLDPSAAVLVGDYLRQGLPLTISYQLFDATVPELEVTCTEAPNRITAFPDQPQLNQRVSGFDPFDDSLSIVLAEGQVMPQHPILGVSYDRDLGTAKASYGREHLDIHIAKEVWDTFVSRSEGNIEESLCSLRAVMSMATHYLQNEPTASAEPSGPFAAFEPEFFTRLDQGETLNQLPREMLDTYAASLARLQGILTDGYRAAGLEIEELTGNRLPQGDLELGVTCRSDTQDTLAVFRGLPYFNQVIRNFDPEQDRIIAVEAPFADGEHADLALTAKFGILDVTTIYGEGGKQTITRQGASITLGNRAEDRSVIEIDDGAWQRALARHQGDQDAALNWLGEKVTSRMLQATSDGRISLDLAIGSGVVKVEEETSVVDVQPMASPPVGTESASWFL